ncbi:MAG TPA: C39 family peptidase [Candidatus Saccharimonadales bacterium]
MKTTEKNYPSSEDCAANSHAAPRSIRRIAALGLAAGLLTASCAGNNYDTPAQFPPTNKTATTDKHGWELATGLREVYFPQQQRAEWCVPAASAMSLLSLTGETISQSTLATKMHTSDTLGTDLADAMPVLDQYANPDGYAYYIADNATVAQQNADLNYDLGVLHAAPIVPITVGDLYWSAQYGSSRHVLTVVGFQPSTGEVAVDDSGDGQMYSLPSKDLFAAEQSPAGQPKLHELVVIGETTSPSTPTN